MSWLRYHDGLRYRRIVDVTDYNERTGEIWAVDEGGVLAHGRPREFQVVAA
ncbi:hypothetical protein [Gordonia sp. (in: high G+C Gram-positive bacteria)]|uniref:hypothetical protein n=1 Tax=Gordonia sp. (in: high G+C Gram-positive bacteria) TaxID=84139 RepID=UPI0039E5C73A